LAMGYLIIPLAFSQDGSCNYQGDIELHLPFESTFEKNCLVTGPPISRIATVKLDGYGERTIQYFEGALLMGDPVGRSQDVEIYPLGKFSQPEAQLLDTGALSTDDTRQFYRFLDETENDQFLGEPVTDFVKMGDRWVIYFENSSLRWNPNNQTASHQSLGRDHLINHYPELLIESDVTQLVIPDTVFRFIPRNTPPQVVAADKYTVDVAVKYPVLYSDKQQVVSVEVVNRLTNEPVTDLTIVGLARYADVLPETSGGDEVQFSLEPTGVPGMYTASVALPNHPNGAAGRHVVVHISFDGANSTRVSAIKKFQTWW